MRLPLGDKNTLIGRASRALGLSFLNIAAARLGTLAVGVLLARLLGPHQFGTYAVAYVALLAVLSFNELGVSLAIVRWPGEPREIAPTVVTLSCVSSAILYAGFFLAAPAFAGAMGAPAATPVIRVLAVCILIDSVAAVPAALLQRYFRQDRRMIADQTNAWLGSAVSIGLAWSGFGAMSLGIGQAAGALGSGILLVVFSPLPFRFGLDLAKARALLVFGLPLAGSSLLVFLVGNVDNLVVGHLLGPTALGFYVLAWNMSSWPVQMFSQPVRNVAPAFFSRLQHDPTAMRTGFVAGAGMLGSLTLPVCLLISGAAAPLITFVYGARWAPAAHALTWLAILGALRILFELVYDYFVVLARSRAVFTVQLAWLGALIPALVAGVRTDGIRGAAIAGVAVAAFVVLPWYLAELHRVGIKVSSLGGQLWMPIMGGVGAGLFAVGLGGVLTSNLMTLALSGMVALGTIGLLFFHKQPELALLRPMFRDRGEPHPAADPVPAAGEPAPPAPPRAAAPAPGAAVTVPIPALQARARRSPRSEETAGAADATIPLPIFQDVGGPLPVYRDLTGLVPRYPPHTEVANRDRVGRHRAWMWDPEEPADGTSQPPGPPGRSGRPGGPGSSGKEGWALAHRQQGPGHEG
jgi:O-antigen/teichoic acid export membrane protein